MRRDKGWGGASTGRAAWVNATRPRGGQKLAKEPLGTLREEGAVLWWEHHKHSSRAFH